MTASLIEYLIEKFFAALVKYEVVHDPDERTWRVQRRFDW